jgi:hypothetical protein
MRSGTYLNRQQKFALVIRSFEFMLEYAPRRLLHYEKVCISAGVSGFFFLFPFLFFFFFLFSLDTQKGN